MTAGRGLPDAAGMCVVRGTFPKFIAMALSEPHIAVAELARIAAPTLVAAGDDDMVSLEHTVALYRAVPGPSWP